MRLNDTGFIHKDCHDDPPLPLLNSPFTIILVHSPLSGGRVSGDCTNLSRWYRKRRTEV